MSVVVQSILATSRAGNAKLDLRCGRNSLISHPNTPSIARQPNVAINRLYHDPTHWNRSCDFKFPQSSFFLSIFQATGNASVYLPAGLNPGDKYQLAFVTTNFIAAVEPTISTYNDFVMTDAELYPILGTSDGVTYTAIVSTYNYVDARDNAWVDAPVYNLDGERIAERFVDMWDGYIEHSIGQDGITMSMVWTGAQSSGHASDYPLGQPAFSDTVGGDPGETDMGDWLDGQLAPQNIDNALYGLSSVITVPDSEPVPEPASVIT